MTDPENETEDVTDVYKGTDSVVWYDTEGEQHCEAT